MSCPEREKRAAMTDDEFWLHVLDIGPAPVDDEPDLDESPELTRPCTECGARGPCAYDAEGRPMIHTEPEGDES